MLTQDQIADIQGFHKVYQNLFKSVDAAIMEPEMRQRGYGNRLMDMAFIRCWIPTNLNGVKG